MELCLVIGACKEGLEVSLQFPREMVPLTYGQCHIHSQASASASASTSCSESSSVFPFGPKLHPKSSSWFQGPHPVPAAGLFQLTLTGSNKEEQPSLFVAHSVGTRSSQSPETSSELSPGSYCDLIQAGC